MTRPRPGRNTFDSSNTIHNIARILALLQAGPKSYAQICESLFMTDRSARRYLRHLRDEPNRRVRIKRFLDVPGGSAPLFELGAAPDAERQKQTEAQRTAKWRAKVKASPDLQDRQRRYESARWAVIKATRAPNNWFSALGAP